MFLIRANDGSTNICTASASRALVDFRSLRRANLNPSIVGFGGRPVSVVALVRHARVQRCIDTRAA